MRIIRALFGAALLSAMLIGCTNPSGTSGFVPHAGMARHVQDSGGGIPGKNTATPNP